MILATLEVRLRPIYQQRKCSTIQMQVCSPQNTGIDAARMTLSATSSRNGFWYVERLSTVYFQSRFREPASLGETLRFRRLSGDLDSSILDGIGGFWRVSLETGGMVFPFRRGLYVRPQQVHTGCGRWESPDFVR